MGTVTESVEDADDEVLWAEWAKSQARAARAFEEVLLLRKEMQRVLEFLQWKATWWLSQDDLRSDDKVLAEGLHAYAHVQADLQLSLATHFCSIWQKPLQEVDNLPRQHGPTPHDIQFTMLAANKEDVVDDGNIYI